MSDRVAIQYADQSALVDTCYQHDCHASATRIKSDFVLSLFLIMHHILMLLAVLILPVDHG